MGRIYTAQFNGVVVTTAQDLFEILAPASGVIRILEWAVMQNTDAGDAQDEVLLISPVSGIDTVTTGSGGSTITAVPIDDGYAAATAIVKANNTTRMAVGTGTLNTLYHHGWNVRVGLEKVYTPETCPVISGGDRWTLALPIAPADSITMSGGVIFEQIGG